MPFGKSKTLWWLWRRRWGGGEGVDGGAAGRAARARVEHVGGLTSRPRAGQPRRPRARTLTSAILARDLSELFACYEAERENQARGTRGNGREDEARWWTARAAGAGTVDGACWRSSAYDTPISMFIPELRQITLYYTTPSCYPRHTIIKIPSVLLLRGLLPGVIELSSPFSLWWTQLGTTENCGKVSYTNEICRVMFAIVFTSCASSGGSRVVLLLEALLLAVQ